MSLSQVCDFWYQASHCLKHFGEMLLTLQAYFFQKMPELSWQSLFGTLTYLFFFFTVRKRFHAFAIEEFTAHPKKGHHHFFDLIRTLYVDTNLLNRSTPPICLLQSSEGFSIGTSTRFLTHFDHR